MIAALVLAAVAAAAPAPIPAPNPCAHRIFCGRIALVPKDPSERRAFIANAALALVDGIVTISGRRTPGYRDVAAFARRDPGVPASVVCDPHGCAAAPPSQPAPAPMVALRFGSRPNEIDPIVRPCANTITEIVACGAAQLAVQSALTRRWSAENRARLDYAEAGAHVAGIATWVPLNQKFRNYRALYADCAAFVAQHGDLRVGPSGEYIAASSPVPQVCEHFSRYEITEEP